MSIDIRNIQTAKSVSKQENGGTFDFLNKDISFSNGQLNDKKKEAFYSELSILLDAALDIRTALDIISNERKQGKDQDLFIKIKETVVDGSSLSEAIKQSGKFSSYEYYSIQIGEETGKLALVLGQLAGYYKKSIAQKRQIVNALSYPVIVLFAAVGAIIFMMYFIVPMFADVFKRFDGELPGITKFVMSVSSWFGDNILYVLGGITSAVAFLFWQRKKLWYRKISSLVTSKLPFIGEMVRKIHMTRFCSVMALLIGSKVNLLQALDLVGKMTSFYPIQASLDQIKEDVTQGKSLNDSMRQFQVYDSRMVSLVKVGEEVNQLEGFFDKVSKQYSDDVEHQTSILGNLVEPFMLIFLGLVVGTILIAMYLPLFKLSTSFGG